MVWIEWEGTGQKENRIREVILRGPSLLRLGEG